MPTERKERVAVAMSGGVDSSLAAALLRDQGYEVVGLTMHLWDPGDGLENFGRCCSPEDIRDARRVADQLGIPHYVVNLRQVFEREVVDRFAAEYLQGRTPNPCILCNDRIKFGPLLRRARELKAAFLATGHYARLERDPAFSCFRLRRGIDRRKDQSYFLFSMTQEQMGKVLFPLGGMAKAEVRRQALERGLRVAQKAESQEICFVADGDYRGFLKARKGDGLCRPGEIVSREGKVLGRHRGIYGFTVGQRRGMGVSASHPLYVLKLDPAENRVVAGTREELLSSGLVAGQVNWIGPGPARGFEVEVQIRYRHPGAPAFLTPLDGGRVRVEFTIPQRSVTPGQAAVFYRGEEVLGGGWIEEAL